MANYVFETMTPAQALLALHGDTITFTAAGASASTVTYLLSAGVEVTSAGRTLDFSTQIEPMSVAGDLIFTDGSTLFIGSEFADRNQVFRDTPGMAAFGGAGDDSLTARGFHSLLQGNQGDDTLSASGGSDTMYGGQDNDVFIMAGGASFAQGNKGDDSVQGSAEGSDTILGGQGNDTLAGSGFLNGNLGNDSVSGHGQLFGEDGNDTLVSGLQGHDTLLAGNGNDSIQANSGTDSLSGDAGDDTISSLGGAHVIAGGAGADHFLFGANSLTPGAVTQITDWSGTEDGIDFVGFTPNPNDLTTGAAADYGAAVTLATTSVTQTHFNFVEVQVGADLYLFAGATGGLSSVVELVGRGLADFSGHNLI